MNSAAPHTSGELRKPSQISGIPFARLDGVALGAAVGLVLAATMFIATNLLVLEGGQPVGPHLSLLSQYIPGYSVGWKGSVVGAFAGLVVGFGLGWTIAVLRNLSVAAYLLVAAFWTRLNRFLEDA